MALRKLILISLLLIGFNSFGQYPMYKLIAKKASSCSYLLDQYSGAAAAYSLRQLDCQYAGSAIRVRRSSDNTESDIGFVNGNLDTATMKTFVGTGGTDDGFVVTWYDQSGSANDAAQSTAGNQAKIMDNGVIYREGVNPTISFSYGLYYNLTTTLASNSDFSTFNVTARSSTANELFGFSNSTTDNTYSFLQYVNGYVYFHDGINYVGGANNVTGITLFSSFSISSSLSLYGDGASLSGVGGSSGGSNTFNAISKRNTTYSTGNISELIFYQSDKSGSRTGIESNINTYYTIY